MSGYNLVSLAGIAVMVGLCWLLSRARRQVNWRAVGWGVGLQFLFAVFVFWLPGGKYVLARINDFVLVLCDCAGEGCAFVFWRPAFQPSAPGDMKFVLAVHGLAAIAFFAAVVSLLYYIGLMPLVIRGFSWLFSRVMRISGAESVCTASSIFVGIESSLTVKPHVEAMTESEMCTVLTAGMATVASNVMVVYVGQLQGTFPNIAGHLVSASLLSAPAAVAISKLLVPETGKPLTLGVDVKPRYDRDANLIEAIINGANTGMKLAISIAAMLIAVVGLMALLGKAVGLTGLNLGSLLGHLGYPFAVLMGVPLEDAKEVGQLLGIRAVMTEIPAYGGLAQFVADKELARNSRSVVIAAYALCGFAHVASLAIFCGGYAAIAPSRTRDLARMGPWALLAATMACLMTGAVAGAFYIESAATAGPF